ncbi:MAG: hypothetical protein R3F11_26805 [Verrucomicrobiales bacterium]
MVVLARLHRARAETEAEDRGEAFLELWRHAPAAGVGARRRHQLAPRRQPRRNKVAVEVAVRIHVGERHHQAGSVERHARQLRLFFKAERAGLFGHVEVKPVRRPVAAQVEVEIAVIVQIGKGGAGGPTVLFHAESGRLGRVAEFQPAQVLKDPRAAERAGQDDLRQTVAIRVPDRHAARRARLADQVVEVLRRVPAGGEVHPALGGRDAAEKRIARRRGARLERLPLQQPAAPILGGRRFGGWVERHRARRWDAGIQFIRRGIRCRRREFGDRLGSLRSVLRPRGDAAARENSGDPKGWL